MPDFENYNTNSLIVLKTLTKRVHSFGKSKRAGDGGSPVRVKDYGKSLPSRGLNIEGSVGADVFLR